MTLDLDFADVRLYPPGSHAGIWVLRPSPQRIDSIIDALRRAVLLLSTEPVTGRLWVVEAGRVRIRG